jgi:hypothetical protein
MIRLPRLSQGGIFDRDTFNRFVDSVESGLRSNEIQPGTGYYVKRGPGGFSLDIPSSSSFQAVTAFPFQCTLSPQSNSNGTPAGNKVRVEYNSILFSSLVPLVAFSGITGLYDPDAATPVELDLDGPDNTTNYTSPSGPDDYVFLEIKFNVSDTSVESVKIDTKGNGSEIDVTYDAWDDSGNALVAQNTATPPVQTYARIVLATYQDGALQQNVNGNLVLENMCLNGQPAVYPVPY